MFRKAALAIALLGMIFAASRSDSAAPQQAGGPPAQAAGASSRKATAHPRAADSKSVKRPKSFDLDAMDKSVAPCEDFYEYACGNWRKNNPIPPDQARWGRFNELAEYNRQLLHEILEKASVRNAKRGPVTQKIGDLYQSCMDEKTVNAQGSAPLKALLDRIAAISNKDELVKTLAY